MEAQALASNVPAASGISKSVLAHGSRPCSCRLKIISGAAWRKLGMRSSTRASSSTGETLVGTWTPQIAPSTNLISKMCSGSPLLWIAVGIGLSAWFSVMATKVKRYAINQAFKAVMGEEAEANGQFNTSAFVSGSPVPSLTAASTTSLPSQSAESSDDIYADELNVNIPPSATVITDKN
ncbi:hypothetical protein IEQ34_012712 [Dendrobium chrysotoxum]|uniref:Uncharacterized protein n=1 Tax=Dendrobium chrysotoxum TaxID=161865 RepID=A0AAV7GPC4_DENCH|nr:hypothetical protein IEQ34_012712 [Dendrobium chrysotoxum]